MKLENRFTVPVPVDQAWQVLLDVERIAPCMPGATLTSVDGDDFEGKVKVKLGPINLTYGGKAHFVSKDEATHVAVIDGSGKETRGTGTAKALITCRLVEDGATTQVEVDTDLAITGKPAQFGRGVLADVSAKLIDQFAACLAKEIETGGGGGTLIPPEPEVPVRTASAPAAPVVPPVQQTPPVEQAAPIKQAAPVSEAAPTGPRLVPPRPAAEPIDLLGTAGLPVLKRLLPVLAGLAALVILLTVRRRRH